MIARSLDLLGHARGLDLVAQLVDLGLLRVVLAQLALDGLELLAQDVLALGLVHLRLDFGLDAALQLEDLDLVREEVGDELETLDDVDRLEQLLALLRAHVGAVGDHVGQEPGLSDVAGRDGGFGRHRRAVRDVLLDLGLDRAHEGLHLETVGRLILDDFDGGAQVGTGLREAVQLQARLALDDRANGPVLQLDDLGDLGQRADGVQLGGIVDLLLLRLALGDERDRSALGDRGVERVDALLAADLERDDHLREDDGLPERDEGQVAHAAIGGGFIVGIDRGGRSLGHVEVLLTFGFGVGGAGPRRRVDRRSVGQRSAVDRSGVDGVRGTGVGSGARTDALRVTRPLGVERLEDAGAEALLQLEQDPDPGEVHASLAGQVADPQDPPDVVLGIEADVGRRPGRAEKPLVLVDAQGSRVRTHEGGRHADDVDGPFGVAIRSRRCHAGMLEP